MKITGETSEAACELISDSNQWKVAKVRRRQHINQDSIATTVLLCNEVVGEGNEGTEVGGACSHEAIDT